MADGKAGPPKGNKNAATNPERQLFINALRRAALDGKKVRAAAEKLLDCAAEGQPWAIKELADRLDGKAVQAVTMSNPDGTSLLSGIEVRFVRTDDAKG